MLQVHMPPTAPNRAVPPVAVTDAFGADTAALVPIVRAVIASVLRERRDHPDVEDCAHEVLRRALEGQSRLRPNEALRPWMLGIARHVAIDHLRARKRAQQRAAYESHDVEQRGELPVDRLVDPSPDPDEQVEQKWREERLRTAIDRLTEGQRKAMMMFHLEGLGYQEIAERLEVPLGTVATWISRGRRTIAAELRPEARTP
jgi:RNA polymerase sigma-70 factor (ECF subfamily)